MDLNDIVVFTKVVETRSFTGAAEQLGIPKSTVSRKLAQLEERLGVRLVQRTTRKLALTEIGQTYYDHCARAVADLAAAEQLVTDMQATPRGRVRVTAPIDLATRYLGEILAHFTAAHPEIHVELEATDRIVDLIEEGFDVGIRFGSLPESTLIARRLCKLESMLVASPAYLARRGTPATVEELEEHERVLFVPNARVQSWILVCGDASYELGRPARIASNNVGVVHQAVRAGAGISALVEFMVADDIASGALVPVLPAWRSRPIDVHAVYPARQNMPPRLGLFLEHLARAFGAAPWAREDGAGAP